MFEKYEFEKKLICHVTILFNSESKTIFTVFYYLSLLFFNIDMISNCFIIFYFPSNVFLDIYSDSCDSFLFFILKCNCL